MEALLTLHLSFWRSVEMSGFTAWSRPCSCRTLSFSNCNTWEALVGGGWSVHQWVSHVPI